MLSENFAIQKNSEKIVILQNKILQLKKQAEICQNFNFTSEQNLSYLTKGLMGAIKVQNLQLMKLFFNRYDCFHI